MRTALCHIGKRQRAVHAKFSISSVRHDREHFPGILRQLRRNTHPQPLRCTLDRRNRKTDRRIAFFCLRKLFIQSFKRRAEQRRIFNRGAKRGKRSFKLAFFHFQSGDRVFTEIPATAILGNIQLFKNAEIPNGGKFFFHRSPVVCPRFSQQPLSSLSTSDLPTAKRVRFGYIGLHKRKKCAVVLFFAAQPLDLRIQKLLFLSEKPFFIFKQRRSGCLLLACACKFPACMFRGFLILAQFFRQRVCVRHAEAAQHGFQPTSGQHTENQA